MLEHGGRLRQAAQEYGIPLADWLDLSTGINPQGYPVPPLDPACWQRLPEDDDGLEAAAAAFYGNPRLLPLPGSQAAIQLLPAFFPPAAVAVLTPVYEEHLQAWTRAGHKLRRLQGATLQRALAAATPNILVCNPNNPTARRFPCEALLDTAAQLRRRGGCLILDEAFGDAEPDNCVTPFAGSEEAPNLIVLRSLGKFFGLAGARVGFVFGDAGKLALLREALGPWPVSGPARTVARLALADLEWQSAARARLLAASSKLTALLSPLGPVESTALFSTLTLADADAAERLFAHLARRGILVRRFAGEAFLRFGLPPESEWERLAATLTGILKNSRPSP